MLRRLITLIHVKSLAQGLTLSKDLINEGCLLFFFLLSILKSLGCVEMDGYVFFTGGLSIASISEFALSESNGVRQGFFKRC